MPTTKTHGTESAANKAIGGVPKVHYLDFKSRGRGQVVRLLLIDAGAAFTDVRYSFAEWPSQKTEGVLTKNPLHKIPIVEMPTSPYLLTQSYAILRHWARLLNAYDGTSDEEKYWVDVINDMVIDWRSLFITAFFSSNQKEDYAKHQTGTRASFLHAVETHLTSSVPDCSGPFIIGNIITYADLTLYQILHDESLVQDGRKGLQEYPRLKGLVDAVESRPNIKKFLESEEYLG